MPGKPSCCDAVMGPACRTPPTTCRPSVAALDPVVVVLLLGADRGLLAVSRQHAGALREREKLVGDGVQDRREVGERTPRGTRAALEEGVAGEDHLELLDVQADRAR